MLYFVTWVLLRTVTVPCPPCTPDEFGRIPSDCARKKCTEVRRLPQSRRFLSKKEALDFFTRGNRLAHTPENAGILSPATGWTTTNLGGGLYQSSWRDPDYEESMTEFELDSVRKDVLRYKDKEWRSE